MGAALPHISDPGMVLWDFYGEESNFMLLPANCLAVATIIQEANLEPYRGKVAVAKVIRERMRLHYASDGTVAGTVLHPYQFSGWNTTSPNRINVCALALSHPAVQDAYKAWIEAAKAWPEFDGVVLYHANAGILAKLGLKKPEWANSAKLVATIGNHLFYKGN